MLNLGDIGNMAGMGQFNLNRKPGNMQPPKPKGREDEEPSMYFRDPSSVFRSDKEILSSGSPSQLTGSNMFGANMYSQPPTSAGIGNITLQQRGMSNPPFQRNITPTSIAPNFGGIPGIPPQQTSPNSSLSGNRNLFGLGQRGIIQTSQAAALSSQLKRPSSSIASSILSSQSSSTTTSSILSSFGRSSGLDQPNLDLSEFPTLGNRSSAPPNPQPIARNYVGMVSKPVQEPTPEFQIQQEDFPALPGTQNPPSSSASDSSRKTPTGSGGLSSYDSSGKDGGKFPGDKMGTNAQQTRRGIQTHPDGTVSIIPHGMVIDQFGMVGLLTFIRAAETDPNLVALAPGIDLTTLGLNLNSPENLYSTFQSPWADSPCRPQDIDFHVPQEYLTNIFIREKLAPIKLNRYGEDLLFFLFYMNGGDVLQLASAAELYNRDWRYHKEERVWITRAPGIDPQLKTNSFEKGTYYFFDAQNWRKVLKEFRLEYDKLEDRPHLPPTLHHNPNQPPVMAH